MLRTPGRDGPSADLVQVRPARAQLARAWRVDPLAGWDRLRFRCCYLRRRGRLRKICQRLGCPPSARAKDLARRVGSADNTYMDLLEFGPRRGSKVAAQLLLGAVLASAWIACSSQDKPGVDVRDDEGLKMCCILSIACDDVETGSGQAGAAGASSAGSPGNAEECHELGHEASPDACRAAYDHCLDLCQVTMSAESAASRSCD